MFRSSPKLRRHVRGDILFGPMFFLGILAAIAIPAYQDYTIRSQVAEGLNLASAAKVAVAEYYASNGTWPANLKAAGFERVPRSNYVAAVTLDKGTVVIHYGRRANLLISRHRLTLRPTTTPRGEVVWSCGYSEDMGVDPKTGPAAPAATDIARKHLPAACRGN
jgi:type IV pilus assembly protein PilA